MTSIKKGIEMTILGQLYGKVPNPSHFVSVLLECSVLETLILIRQTFDGSVENGQKVFFGFHFVEILLCFLSSL